jgi:hypothetical protein
MTSKPVLSADYSLSKDMYWKSGFRDLFSNIGTEERSAHQLVFGRKEKPRRRSAAPSLRIYVPLKITYSSSGELSAPTLSTAAYPLSLPPASVPSPFADTQQVATRRFTTEDSKAGKVTRCIEIGIPFWPPVTKDPKGGVEVHHNICYLREYHQYSFKELRLNYYSTVGRNTEANRVSWKTLPTDAYWQLPPPTLTRKLRKKEYTEDNNFSDAFDD